MPTYDPHDLLDPSITAQLPHTHLQDLTPETAHANTDARLRTIGNADPTAAHYARAAYADLQDRGLEAVTDAAHAHAQAAAAAAAAKVRLREVVLAAQRHHVSAAYLSRLAGVSRNAINAWVTEAGQNRTT